MSLVDQATQAALEAAERTALCYFHPHTVKRAVKVILEAYQDATRGPLSAAVGLAEGIRDQELSATTDLYEKLKRPTEYAVNSKEYEAQSDKLLNANMLCDQLHGLLT